MNATLERTIQQIFELPNSTGFLAKLSLLGRIEKSEIQKLFNTEKCDNGGLCFCYKLHVIDLHNGLTVIISTQSKSLLKMRLLPSRMWGSFRNMVWCDGKDVDAAEEKIGIKFDEIALLFSMVQKNSTLARPISHATARRYVLNHLRNLAENYCKRWEKVGIIILPVI